MDLMQQIGAAINANNGECPVIENALVNAMDFVMSKTPNDAKPSLKVESVFGQSRLEVSDGVNVVTLDIALKGVKQLIDEFVKVLEVADSNEGDVSQDEPIRERLEHLERLCDTISDEVNWVRARDQIRAIRLWVLDRETLNSVR